MATKTMKIGLSDADKAAMQAAVVALIKASLITPYSTSATYAVGDFVYYSGDGKIYKCTTAISTAESWTSAHWSEATLNDIIDAVNAAVASVNNKVEPDDICPELRAGYAFTSDNLIATKGLTVSDDPMSFGMVGGAQKSAVGDGNASLNKLVCVDVVRNQLVPNLADSTIVRQGITVTVKNNVLTLNGTGDGTQTYANLMDAFTISAVAGHRYLVVNTSNDDNVYAAISGSGYDELFGHTRIYTATKTAEGTVYLRADARTTASYDNVSFIFKIIDLDKYFGSSDVVSAIIGTGTSDEQVARLIAYDPEILNDTDYDAGTLVPSKTAKLLSVGVNQWDEEWEVGVYNNANGNKGVQASGYLRSKNFIRVSPNTKYYLLLGLWIFYYDANHNYLGFRTSGATNPFTTPSNCSYITFNTDANYGNAYNHDICINISDPNINGKYYPSKRNPVTLPNYEGHGILKVVDGKVVADGTELYPDGNSKKRYRTYTFTGNETWSDYGSNGAKGTNVVGDSKTFSSNVVPPILSNTGLIPATRDSIYSGGSGITINAPYVYVSDTSNLAGKTIVYELATEQDITTPVFQSTFPVEQGGTLQFLDEDDNPIAGLQGSEIFYQKNIKAFVEALGEATDWDPERIKRLGNLSFTPEYVDITLNPSPTGAYARAQVYNATFTIVISAALTGTASGSITFQDSEVDLTNFQTKPADAIYDMDGKKVSEAPTTTDCNIASFVGRSKNGIVLWSLLHSGVNKVKIHIEDAVPLDADGNGKIDCRASLIL